MEVVRTMTMVKLSELEKGDVLLCHGESLLSIGIEVLTMSEYSHAAIYVGRGQVITEGPTASEPPVDHRLLQAESAGIRYAYVTTLLADETYIDVFRFDKQGHHFGEADYPVDPVMKISETMSKSDISYATSHLIFLGLLAVYLDFERFKLGKFEFKLVRALLDEATSLLFKLIDKGKKPMVCSEVVYRCFDEADESQKYSLAIPELTFKGLVEKSNASFNQTPSDDIRDEFEKYSTARSLFMETLRKARPEYDFAQIDSLDFSQHIAPFVMPRDLEQSPDIPCIGRLEASKEK